MLTKQLRHAIKNTYCKLISTSSQLNRKVTLLGAAGNVGKPLSLLLKSNPIITRLAVYDNAKQIIQMANELSLVNTPAVVQFGYGLRQLQSTLQDTEVVIICAGVPRKSGECRGDLFDANAEIVHDLAMECTKYCPQAMVVLITNPINSLIPVISEVYKQKDCYKPNRIFGVTTLDVVRAVTLVSNYFKKPPKTIKIPVIGGHSLNTIIPVISQIKPTNLKFQSMDDWHNIITEIKTASTQVIETKGTVTSSMAYAGAKFCNSLIGAMNGRKNIVECAYVKSNDEIVAYLATPLLLNQDGVAENYGVGVLNDYEKLLLNDAIPYLLSDIKRGVDFITDKKRGKNAKAITCHELFRVSSN